MYDMRCLFLNKAPLKRGKGVDTFSWERKRKRYSYRTPHIKWCFISQRAKELLCAVARIVRFRADLEWHLPRWGSWYGCARNCIFWTHYTHYTHYTCTKKAHTRIYTHALCMICSVYLLLVRFTSYRHACMYNVAHTNFLKCRICIKAYTYIYAARRWKETNALTHIITREPMGLMLRVIW